MKREWQVYLSGEIHSDWREHVIKGASVRIPALP